MDKKDVKIIKNNKLSNMTKEKPQEDLDEFIFAEQDNKKCSEK